MTKETSIDVASIAARLISITADDLLDAATEPTSVGQLADEIAAVAASALGQREAEPVNTCEMPEVAAMRYIEQLRAVEGDSVTILCDNPEASTTAEQTAVDCNGGWTEYQDRRFLGESVLQCLARAVIALQAAEAGQ